MGIDTRVRREPVSGFELLVSGLPNAARTGSAPNSGCRSGQCRGPCDAAGARDPFSSAMRISLGHVASSVHTLVFAYAGSAMTILLLITAHQRGLAEMPTIEQIGQEIVRRLVVAIGPALAVPFTTAFALFMALKETTPGPGQPELDPPGLGSHNESTISKRFLWP